MKSIVKQHPSSTGFPLSWRKERMYLMIFAFRNLLDSAVFLYYTYFCYYDMNIGFFVHQPLFVVDVQASTSALGALFSQIRILLTYFHPNSFLLLLFFFGWFGLLFCTSLYKNDKDFSFQLVFMIYLVFVFIIFTQQSTFSTIGIIMSVNQSINHSLFFSVTFCDFLCEKCEAKSVKKLF